LFAFIYLSSHFTFFIVYCFFFRALCFIYCRMGGYVCLFIYNFFCLLSQQFIISFAAMVAILVVGVVAILVFVHYTPKSAGDIDGSGGAVRSGMHGALSQDSTHSDAGLSGGSGGGSGGVLYMDDDDDAEAATRQYTKGDTGGGGGGGRFNSASGTTAFAGGGGRRSSGSGSVKGSKNSSSSGNGGGGLSGITATKAKSLLALSAAFIRDRTLRRGASALKEQQAQNKVGVSFYFSLVIS
jgi:hypothetical protein